MNGLANLAASFLVEILTANINGVLKKEGGDAMAKIDDFRSEYERGLQKIMDLQAQIAASGMSAEEENQALEMMKHLADTADPEKPNPDPVPTPGNP